MAPSDGTQWWHPVVAAVSRPASSPHAGLLAARAAVFSSRWHAPGSGVALLRVCNGQRALLDEHPDGRRPV